MSRTRRQGWPDGGRESRLPGSPLLLLASVALTAAGLAGCRSPFGPAPGDTGPLLDRARLRTAEVLPLEQDGSGGPDDDAELPRELPDSPSEVGAAVTISIEQARAWTLEHNLDLQVAMVDPQIGAATLSEEEARFEALFFARGGLSDTDDGQSEIFPDQFVRPWDLAPGVTIPLRSGGAFEVALPMSREETFPGFVTDQYSTDFEVSLRQPILRGAGRRTNTHPIRIAALDEQVAEARTRLEVIRQLAAVDRAYWLLFEAQRVLAVRRDSYARAWEQFDRAQARFDSGLGARIEVTRAQAGVSRRLEDVIVAELVARDRQRLLKRIMNRQAMDVDSPTRIELASVPDPVQYRLDPAILLETALAQRAELLELELALARDVSTIEFEENQRLPLFTLDYTYRVDGQGPDFGDAIDGLGTFDRDGWRLGLDVEIPLGNEAAEARVRRAVLVRMQRMATRSLREQRIKQEVLAAIDNVDLTWQRIRAARRNVILEQRNYEAEQGQFELGLRNSTEVLSAESSLVSAMIAEISAHVDYQVAQIDLAFATGTLLGASRVSW